MPCLNHDEDIQFKAGDRVSYYILSSAKTPGTPRPKPLSSILPRRPYNQFVYLYTQGSASVWTDLFSEGADAIYAQCSLNSVFLIARPSDSHGCVASELPN